MTRSSPARTRRKATKAFVSPGTRKAVRKAKDLIITEAATDLIGRTGGNDKAPYGSMQKVLDRYSYFELTRSQVQKRFLKIKNQASRRTLFVPNTDVPAFPVDEILIPSISTPPSLLTGPSSGLGLSTSTGTTTGTDSGALSSGRAKGGRPHGSTDEVKRLKDANLINAINEAAVGQQKERGRARKAKGEFIALLRNIEEAHNLPENALDRHKFTIRKRAERNNPSGKSESQTSPMHSVEPTIVAYCIKCSRIGQPLTQDQVLALAISLIEGTDVAVRVIAWKKKYSHYYDDRPLLGKGWYNAFMSRHHDILRKGKARTKDMNRQEWVTYENFKNMYEAVYETMVMAGVAKKLPEAVWFDRDGKIVFNEEEAFGEKSQYVLEHPEYCVYVDETGSNTNQKQDGHVGGRRFVLPVGESEVGRVGAINDLHFTTLVFTAATGQPIMVAVILKSEKSADEVPISWKLGIDWTKLNAKTRDGEDITRTNPIETFNDNEAAMCGGPVCHFRNKEIPCFVGTSPKASITSQLLADMLKTIDDAEVFDRIPGGPVPFLLLDGHHSRLEVPFLDYIFNDDHKWFVCIGVPYATHYWQVADSSELNGTYKMALTKGKEAHFRAKPPGHRSWSMTDIIPLVNYAYPLSFGIIERGKKATLFRGWGPLNYYLLQNPDILSTKAKSAEEIPEPAGGDNSINQSSFLNPGITLSAKKGIADDMMQEFVRDAMKDEGRKEKIRQKRREEVGIADTVKKLKEMTKVTSGSLASHGMYQIAPGTHREVAERRALRLAGDAETQKKRAVREERIVVGRQVAREKRTSTARCSMQQGDLQRLSQELKQQGDSPQKKSRTETEAQLKRRELRAAKEKESNGNHLNVVDFRVLLEDLYTEGDDDEVRLLLKSRDELQVELLRRRNRNIM
jgi:hypothetical protein